MAQSWKKPFLDQIEGSEYPSIAIGLHYRQSATKQKPLRSVSEVSIRFVIAIGAVPLRTIGPVGRGLTVTTLR